MKRKLWLSAAVGVTLTAVIITSYYSPLLTMHRIYTAANQGETDRLPDHVDFPALRENLKATAMTAMSRSLQKNEDLDNPFAKLGMALATTFVNAIVEMMVSPAGLSALIKGGKPPDLESLTKSSNDSKTPDEPKSKKQKISFGIKYTAWDRALIFREGQQDKGNFVLRRNGLWSWKLVNVEIKGLMPEE